LFGQHNPGPTWDPGFGWSRSQGRGHRRQSRSRQAIPRSGAGRDPDGVPGKWGSQRGCIGLMEFSTKGSAARYSATKQARQARFPVPQIMANSNAQFVAKTKPFNFEGDSETDELELLACSGKNFPGRRRCGEFNGHSQPRGRRGCGDGLHSSVRLRSLAGPRRGPGGLKCELEKKMRDAKLAAANAGGARTGSSFRLCQWAARAEVCIRLGFLLLAGEGRS